MRERTATNGTGGPWRGAGIAPLDPSSLRLHNRRPTRWTTGVVESLLSRGSERDVLRLFRELRRDPWGPAARAALRTTPHLKEHPWIYGEPRLIEACLARWRQGADDG